LNQKCGPLVLIIIDGWGYSPRIEGNAIALAATPYYDEFRENYPQTLLEASGTRVGLPAGVMGNSEVGHLNIGAGRVIRMDVSRVDHDIATGEFFRNEVLLAAIDGVKKRGKTLHLMGLLSDGQVHSSQEHSMRCFVSQNNVAWSASSYTAFSMGAIRLLPQPDTTLKLYRRRSRKSVAAKSLPLSDATMQWIAINAGREPSAPTSCW